MRTLNERAGDRTASFASASYWHGRAIDINRLQMPMPMRRRPRGGSRPSLAVSFPSWTKKKARGMPGAGRNPWPACRKERRRQSPQVQPKHPAFPVRRF